MPEPRQLWPTLVKHERKSEGEGNTMAMATGVAVGGLPKRQVEKNEVSRIGD